MEGTEDHRVCREHETTCEDACRVRRDHGPENFATIRQIAHNLLNRAGDNRSIRRKINQCCWEDDFLASVVAGF